MENLVYYYSQLPMEWSRYRWMKMSNSYPYVLPGIAEKEVLDHDLVIWHWFFLLAIYLSQASSSFMVSLIDEIWPCHQAGIEPRMSHVSINLVRSIAVPFNPAAKAQASARSHFQLVNPRGTSPFTALAYSLPIAAHLKLPSPYLESKWPTIVSRFILHHFYVKAGF